MPHRRPPDRSHFAPIATTSETLRYGGFEGVERRGSRPLQVLSGQLAQSKPSGAAMCKLRNPGPLLRRGLIDRSAELLGDDWLCIDLCARYGGTCSYSFTVITGHDFPILPHRAESVNLSCPIRDAFRFLGATDEPLHRSAG